ncbi:MAG: hypothetical protein J6X44_10200 [Thermoguttaceae bacterium]|nr:hypothetical protein [Thermoguttaceae bacterium]
MKSNEKLSGGTATLSSGRVRLRAEPARRRRSGERLCGTRKTQPYESMRGVFAQYANSELREKEEGAWERAVAEKYSRFHYC